MLIAEDTPVGTAGMGQKYGNDKGLVGSVDIVIAVQASPVLKATGSQLLIVVADATKPGELGPLFNFSKHS